MKMSDDPVSIDYHINLNFAMPVWYHAVSMKMKRTRVIPKKMSRI
jgi:hypothetical protein